jgi:hypothetical protein
MRAFKTQVGFIAYRPELRQALMSPVMSIVHLKPHTIACTPSTAIVNINTFDIDQVSQMIDDHILDNNIKRKMINALQHTDMRAYHLDKLKLINFIDCNCNCILKITNNSQNALQNDREFAINVTTLHL